MEVCPINEFPITCLEAERERLLNIVAENNFNLQNEKVIKASERMDQFILYYYYRKQRKEKNFHK